jgi:hypothetical protein
VSTHEGGSWFSVIQAKYLLCKLLAPVITRSRRRMFEE